MGKTSHFIALNANISKTVGDTTKVTVSLMTNRKLHMCFRLAISLILDADVLLRVLPTIVRPMSTKSAPIYKLSHVKLLQLCLHCNT